MNALIVVDMQNDFMPGGPLGVPGGRDVIPLINRLMDRADLVVATQDWHPRRHGSFASNQGGRQPGDVIELAGLAQVLWPDHCVQGTAGADLVDGLEVTPISAVVRKGMDPGVQVKVRRQDRVRIVSMPPVRAEEPKAEKGEP